jgi:hypothetical protein
MEKNGSQIGGEGQLEQKDKHIPITAFSHQSNAPEEGAARIGNAAQ